MFMRTLLTLLSLVLPAASVVSANEPEIANKAGIVVKLQRANDDGMVLSIALSTLDTGIKQPTYTGVRIVNDTLPLDGKRTLFGFRNGDDVTHVKLPTRQVILGNETYTYVDTSVDRTENGMFSLSPSSSDSDAYHLKGVFYAYGNLFVIDDIVRLNEEKSYYEPQ